MLRPILVFLERFGGVLGRVLLTIVYLVAVAPVAALYRLLADPLRVKRVPASTFRPWTEVNDSLDDARRQD